VLVVAVALLIIFKSGVDSKNESLKADLTVLQQQMSQLQANKNEADAIKIQITDAQNQLVILQGDYQSFLSQRYPWSQILSEIVDLVPGSKITLESIAIKSTSENQLAITGTSAKRLTVYDYVMALEDSYFFTGVDFNFGDCPEVDNCQFTITASLASNASETEGGTNE